MIFTARRLGESVGSICKYERQEGKLKLQTVQYLKNSESKHFISCENKSYKLVFC